MSWHYLREQEAVSSEAISWDGEQFAPSKSKNTLGMYCLLDSGTASCHTSLSGMTSEHSTEQSGADGSTLSAADSHAKTSVQQEKARESRENEAGYGLTWPASQAKFDRDTSSWKIHPCLFPEDSMLSSPTLPRWGTMRNGELLEAQMPSGLAEYRSSIMSAIDCSLSLRAPTLTVCGNYNRKGVSPTSGDGLATFVKRLPTLVSTDADKWNRKTEEERKAKGNFVRLSNALGAGGPMTPTWCEWYMGFPLGWTELRPLAMYKFRQWLHSHGLSSEND